ncbi:MAG TPA: hypothetical protein VFX98_04920 [Longimicrobiaceae bacterium]|nr:hypothetical protein [Longimicrobiaceae bacterium]
MPNTPKQTDIETFLQELPPLNPALVQGNCNVAPLPHPETQGEIAAPVETESKPRRR